MLHNMHMPLTTHSFINLIRQVDILHICLSFRNSLLVLHILLTEYMIYHTQEHILAIYSIYSTGILNSETVS